MIQSIAVELFVAGDMFCIFCGKQISKQISIHQSETLPPCEHLLFIVVDELYLYECSNILPPDESGFVESEEDHYESTNLIERISQFEQLPEDSFIIETGIRRDSPKVYFGFSPTPLVNT